MDQELLKIAGAETLLAKTVHDIESAMVDVQVAKAMESGNKVLKELQTLVSIEKFEEIYDEH